MACDEPLVLRGARELTAQDLAEAGWLYRGLVERQSTVDGDQVVSGDLVSSLRGQVVWLS
jgi:hypothetical protein